MAEKKVALTFDDGPHPKQTPQILDILKEYGVRATFFMVGENAERNWNSITPPHKIKRMFVLYHIFPKK